MLNGQLRVVNLGLAFPVHGVETKLLLVDTVGEAKEWVVGTLHHADSLLLSAVELAALIIGGDWNQVSQLLISIEGFESDAEFDLVVE